MTSIPQNNSQDEPRRNMEGYLHIAYSGKNFGKIYIDDISVEDREAMGIEVLCDHHGSFSEELAFTHGTQRTMPIRASVTQSLFDGTLKHFMTYSVDGSPPPLAAGRSHRATPGTAEEKVNSGNVASGV